MVAGCLGSPCLWGVGIPLNWAVALQQSSPNQLPLVFPPFWLLLRIHFSLQPEWCAGRLAQLWLPHSFPLLQPVAGFRKARRSLQTRVALPRSSFPLRTLRLLALSEPTTGSALCDLHAARPTLFQPSLRMPGVDPGALSVQSSCPAPAEQRPKSSPRRAALGVELWG